jgi:hypothetical protein
MPGRAGTFERTAARRSGGVGVTAGLVNSGLLDLRGLVPRLTLADNLPWCPGKGFQTPKTTVPFNLWAAVLVSDAEMAVDVV